MNDDLVIRYQQYDTLRLVTIIESEFEEYTNVAKNCAEQVLKARNVLPNTLHALALNLWENKIRDNLRQYLRDNLLPESKFLTDVELRELFRMEYDRFVERKQTLAVDSTKYWFF
jgi:hypothetical protein